MLAARVCSDAGVRLVVSGARACTKVIFLFRQFDLDDSAFNEFLMNTLIMPISHPAKTSDALA
jgi:hypothetical protein